MGLLAVIVCALALVGLLVARHKLWKLSNDFESDDPERPALRWASVFCLVIVLVSGAVIVDDYVYDLPNPFSGPEVGEEVPDESLPPPEPDKPEPRGKDLRPDMDDVRDEHRDQLDEFEDRDN